MKRLSWTGTLLVVALLMAGCGKAQPERPAVLAGAQVRRRNARPAPPRGRSGG